MRDDVFVNPYNFIHLPEEKAKAYTDEDKHSGVIHYTVTTKTPLFIPNTSNNDAFGMNDDGHNSFDFFSYTDLTGKKVDNNTFYEPVIPGSEMRGVIRNVYETLTDSCMGLLNDVHPAKRIGAAFRPGLLKWNGNKIELFEARSYRIGEKYPKKDEDNPENTSKICNYNNGQKLFFSKPKQIEEDNKKYYEAIGDDYSKEKNQYNNTGYLIKWGFSKFKSKTNKKFYHVYEKQNNKPVYSSDPKIIKDSVTSLIKSYIEQKPKSKYVAAYSDYLADFIEFLDKKNTSNCFPVNYSLLKLLSLNGELKKNFYFAPAIFSKEVSNESINELAKEFAPCSSSTSLCPTCDLFGNILDENSHTSKIRFSDLQVKEKKENCKDYYEKIVTLSNLSSPKLGNVDFYLKKPDNATFWTYDYYVENGKIKNWNGELRGRKYYWHHQKVVLPNGIEPTKQNKTIRPVTRNVVFCGDLYFDGISKKQLNQLIYILNTSKNNLGYKLGMGKPLGLGSIACEVEGVKEREIKTKENNVSYEIKNYDFSNINYENAHFSDSVKAEFEKIASFGAIPSDIEIIYPKTKNADDNGFEWFVANHDNGTITSREKMIIHHALPNILDSDNTLPRLKAKTKEDSRKYKSFHTPRQKNSKTILMNTNKRKYANSNKHKPR